ncbi:MAG: N-acetylmuramoyl-L-alanine amidase [Herbinix sp.]|jgi:N-acetylmuramoyl-L-alanine amidase|nr:N-acetylmuramoyl-L-alanine amidase [Herbinix sp.]
MVYNDKHRCGCKDLKQLQLENRKIKVILDPGHGGEDLGETYAGAYEKDRNLVFAKAVGDKLIEDNFDVFYTRTDDSDVLNDQRRNIVNESGTDLMVSIHRSTILNQKGVPGAEVILYDPNELASTAARNIINELENVGYSNKGVITSGGDISEYANFNVPRVLLIAGVYPYIQGTTTEENYDASVNAIVEGIKKTFQLQTQAFHTEGKYKVLIARFRLHEEAVHMQYHLSRVGLLTVISKIGDTFDLHSEVFTNLDETAYYERDLKYAGYNTIILTHN